MYGKSPFPDSDLIGGLMFSEYSTSSSVDRSGVYSLALYGGLILFSMFLLYDTQNSIKKAETYPKYNLKGYEAYDPINK